MLDSYGACIGRDLLKSGRRKDRLNGQPRLAGVGVVEGIRRATIGQKVQHNCSKEGTG